MDVTPADKELKITADRPFYYTVRQQGFFKQPQTEPLRQGLEVYKEYLDKDGKPISHARIGDEITVKISLRSLKGDNINDIAVVDLIPGCFEIVGNSINVDGWFDFGEIREDRALVYLTAEPKTRTVTYRAKVVARGEFVVPAVLPMPCMTTAYRRTALLPALLRNRRCGCARSISREHMRQSWRW